MEEKQKKPKNWAPLIKKTALIVSISVFCVCLAFFIASSVLTFNNLIKLHNSGLTTPDCWKELCKNWWSLLNASVSTDGKVRLWGSNYLYTIASIGGISLGALIVCICVILVTSRKKYEKK